MRDQIRFDLESEVIPPDRRDAIRLNVAKRPDVPDVLEQLEAPLSSGSRFRGPGTGQLSDTCEMAARSRRGHERGSSGALC